VRPIAPALAVSGPKGTKRTWNQAIAVTKDVEQLKATTTTASIASKIEERTEINITVTRKSKFGPVFNSSAASGGPTVPLKSEPINKIEFKAALQMRMHYCNMIVVDHGCSKKHLQYCSPSPASFKAKDKQRQY
jgi:hypothetical protein